ncbi:hypothetical protein Cantr_00373 [Candida viswanathii]|uniref:LysM domain-containing protein n=1 Tax=Candida viswanathii TaxID=5486 RepID=A0A367YFY6_9ASCO|nr:hypothetical protein Cantr_00373 [Candida viswanathii]
MFILIPLLAIFQLSIAEEYKNCGASPVSDFCNAVTWQSNDTCSSVAGRNNLTVSQLVYHNFYTSSGYLNSYYCSRFTDGDHICLDEPDYSECGNYSFCLFERPEYFCDTYTLDRDYVTCQEICDINNITMEEFKEWNRHNDLPLRCWDDTYMLQFEVYCVSQPNITNFTDCVSIAQAENNPSNVAYYSSRSQRPIGPLSTSTSSSYTGFYPDTSTISRLRTTTTSRFNRASDTDTVSPSNTASPSIEGGPLNASDDNPSESSSPTDASDAPDRQTASGAGSSVQVMSWALFFNLLLSLI